MIPCLIDTNVFVTAKRDHYRFPVFPGFWDWLIKANEEGMIYRIDKVKDELASYGDDLAQWAATLSVDFFLPTDNSVVPAFSRLSRWASAQPNYRQTAIATFLGSTDLWLIAHALTRGWRVVTHEVSAPGSKKNIKIPDACDSVNVACISPFEMLEELGARFIM